jgi:hypothetical protein
VPSLFSLSAACMLTAAGLHVSVGEKEMPGFLAAEHLTDQPGLVERMLRCAALACSHAYNLTDCLALRCRCICLFPPVPRIADPCPPDCTRWTPSSRTHWCCLARARCCRGCRLHSSPRSRPPPPPPPCRRRLARCRSARDCPRMCAALAITASSSVWCTGCLAWPAASTSSLVATCPPPTPRARPSLLRSKRWDPGALGSSARAALAVSSRAPASLTPVQHTHCSSHSASLNPP